MRSDVCILDGSSHCPSDCLTQMLMAAGPKLTMKQPFMADKLSRMLSDKLALSLTQRKRVAAAQAPEEQQPGVTWCLASLPK